MSIAYAPLKNEIAQLKEYASSPTEIVTISNIKQIIDSVNQLLRRYGTNDQIEEIYKLVFILDQKLGTDLVDEIQFSTNHGNLHTFMTKLRLALIRQSTNQLEALMHVVQDEMSVLPIEEQLSIRAEVNFVFNKCDECIAYHKAINYVDERRIVRINTRLQEWITLYKDIPHQEKELIKYRIKGELNQMIHYINKVCTTAHKGIEIAYGKIFLLRNMLQNNWAHDLQTNPIQDVLFQSHITNPDFAGSLDALRQWIARKQYDAMDLLLARVMNEFQALPSSQKKDLFDEACLVFEMAEQEQP